MSQAYGIKVFSNQCVNNCWSLYVCLCFWSCFLSVGHPCPCLAPARHQWTLITLQRVAQAERTGVKLGVPLDLYAVFLFSQSHLLMGTGEGGVKRHWMDFLKLQWWFPLLYPQKEQSRDFRASQRYTFKSLTLIIRTLNLTSVTKRNYFALVF